MVESLYYGRYLFVLVRKRRADLSTIPLLLVPGLLGLGALSFKAPINMGWPKERPALLL
jgi:hypothetical protein